MRTPPEAVAAAQEAVADHENTITGLCDGVVAGFYGLAASGFNTAYDHQLAIPEQYRHGWSDSPPAGALILYGDSQPGHITISDGNGNEISTDIDGNGHVWLDPVGTVQAKWNLPGKFWADAWYGSQGVELVEDTTVTTPVPLTAQQTTDAVWEAATVARTVNGVIEHIPALQELADSKTLGIQNQDMLTAIQSAVATIDAAVASDNTELMTALTALKAQLTTMADNALGNPITVSVSLTEAQLQAIAVAVQAQLNPPAPG